MFPAVFSTNLLHLPIYPIFLALSIFLGTFLFWRSGRHELFDSDFLFDIIIVSGLGALLVGRIFAFIIFTDKFAWLPKRLIFFNVYGGFDFYGALLGALLACTLYLKRKKVSVFKIFDLACAPIAFAQSTLALGNLLRLAKPLFLYYFIGYFLIFWVLKRLEVKKRHVGFFACFYLISISILDLGLFIFRENPVKIANLIPYNLIAAISMLAFGSFSWYILARRNPKEDIKGFFALLLLALFRVKRSITNLGEADEVAKFVILSPYYVLRLIILLARVILLEFIGGTRDFMQALGIRKLK